MKFTNVAECLEALREVFADAGRAEWFVAGLALPFMLLAALLMDVAVALKGAVRRLS